LAGHVACREGFIIACFVGQRHWMGQKMWHRSLSITQWKKLVERLGHRWKILTSSYILYKCDVAMGLIWLRVLVNREWMFILKIVWKSTVVGKLFYMKAVLWAGWWSNLPSIIGREKLSVIYKAFRQPLRPAQTPIHSVLRVKWLGQEADHLSLSGARVKNVWSCMHSNYKLFYTLSVWYLMKHWGTCTLQRVLLYYCVVFCCSQHKLSCEQ